MDKTFHNKEVIDELIRKLELYRDEGDFERYTDDCFVQDVMYFVGVSIDEKEYHHADGYRRFVMRHIWPFAKRVNETTKDLFQRRLK